VDESKEAYIEMEQKNRRKVDVLKDEEETLFETKTETELEPSAVEGSEDHVLGHKGGASKENREKEYGLNNGRDRNHSKEETKRKIEIKKMGCKAEENVD
jgi:hypothetical protein